ncbi:alpha-ketoacid dehydrogenase subunit beta [Desulforhopalus singaporensis]|uniref:Pyruvate dehydrogenase E1 component beta subunit n=1 Tax=Desulforhopalus singaporensis TaxID=91360 RepID=A0A1H0T1Y8_9BACT|nr:alpha-ketoacid dehydrogenase subunit beta [Desulforhopalus singaporensis]SDP47720.1 pyruvate dehydrogenase E1 component beta subunit [Desulforhopalus singaporensis]
MSMGFNTIAGAISQAITEEMRRDANVVLIGEDVTTGIFGVTAGLVDEFGTDRFCDTPISENAIIGCAVGAAMTGMRPIAEIMFQDFLTCCMDPIVNQAAKMSYMSGGTFSVPMVVRSPGGAGLGAGPQHSQSLASWFMGVPGLKVVSPSSPIDAKGLLKSAIRDNNPVIFLENKLLYFESGEVPDDIDFTIPLGQASVLREGDDVTIVAVSGMVPRALRVADELGAEGVSVEIVDPRTLYPLDTETILQSVKKTGRLVTAEEGVMTCGVGAELAALIAEKAYDCLDGPIVRVGTPHVNYAYNQEMEWATIPDEQDLVRAVKKAIGQE